MPDRFFDTYPRHLRLGLIEAIPEFRVAPRFREDIRGIYASASLKRRERGKALSYIRNIRGIYASASLKLQHIDKLRRRISLYPRHLRLGLIEACNISAAVL